MAIYATKKTRDIMPAGNYPATCVQIYDIGSQPTLWGNKPQILVQFETEEMQTNGHLFTPSKNYTLSMEEKANLRKDTERWLGRALNPEELNSFDFETLKGLPCLISVSVKTSQKGSQYNVIDSVSKLPKGMKAPIVTGTYTTIPDWIKAKITAGNTVNNTTSNATESNTQVPF